MSDTPKPPDEEVEKLALVIAAHIASAEAMNATLGQNFSHPERRKRLEIYLKHHLNNLVLAREQAAVARAIKSCAKEVVDNWESPLRNGKPGPIAQAILAKLP